MTKTFYKTIIIEDQKADAQILTQALTTHFPKIQIVATCTNLTTAELQIRKHQPQLIFLDINLGNENGFDLLENIKDLTLHFIVVTAYNQYLITALRASATDFLQKPYPDTELIQAVNNTLKKIETNQHTPTIHTQHQQLINQIPYSINIKHKISLHTHKGCILVPRNEIVFIQSDGGKAGNKALIRFTPHFQSTLGDTAQDLISISDTLKTFETLLYPYFFVRIHKSYIINLQHLKLYNNKNGDLIMHHFPNQELTISKEYRHNFNQRYSEYTLD